MKKYLKNIMISMIICFTLLSLVNLAQTRIEYSTRLKENVVPIISGEVTEEVKEADEQLYNRFKEQYGQEVPSTLLAYYQGYFLGQASMIENQQIVIGASIIGGIVIGIIFTIVKKYIENRKAKKTDKLK